MKNILVLGNLPLATKVMKHILNHPEANLAGVVVPEEDKAYPSSDGEICAHAFAKKERIPRFKLKDISEEHEFDLAISARNNEILPAWFLNTFPLGVVNCHGGYLPNYKGVGGHIFPIVNGEEYSGGTIHWMSEGVDNGDIIERRIVPIRPNETGYSLFVKINDVLFRLIAENLNDIIRGVAKCVPQSKLELSSGKGRSFFYYKKDLASLLNKNKFNEREKRALYWPGKQNGKSEV